MSDGMVERVARALCVASETDVTGSRIDPDRIVNFGPGVGTKAAPYWTAFVPMAKAALLAMRDPSEGMMNASMAAAGWDMPIHPENKDAPGSALREYQAAIDAALSEEPVQTISVAPTI